MNQIKNAVRRHSLKFHPDKNIDGANTFLEIQKISQVNYIYFIHLNCIK